MRKILLVATREYRAMVATKGFIIALTIMPLLMFGGIFAHRFLEDRAGPKQKKIVVIDATGELFAALSEAAAARNRAEILDLETGKQIKPRYLLEAVAAPVTAEGRFELSERVRHGEIDAFLEIPAAIIEMPPPDDGPRVAFYAENVALSKEKGWLQWKLNDLVQTHRLKQVGLDPVLVGQAGAPVAIKGLGLVERNVEGKFETPQEGHEALSIFLPFGMMMLMFMVIFLGAQPMLENVLEEKSQRIAEVMLGSVNATQWMSGKLLGGVAGSLTILAVYAIGGLALAGYYQVLDLVPLRVVPWFLVYQVLAVMLFGSLFMAVGACVNQPKEAQGMLIPVWLLMWFPMLIWLQVVREPTSSFATWLSFVPPATPLLMVLRVSSSAAVPLWQPALGIVVMLAATLLCVLAAARIFRIGILAQGKTPKLSQLLRWAVNG